MGLRSCHECGQRVSTEGLGHISTTKPRKTRGAAARPRGHRGKAEDRSLRRRCELVQDQEPAVLPDGGPRRSLPWTTLTAPRKRTAVFQLLCFAACDFYRGCSTVLAGTEGVNVSSGYQHTALVGGSRLTWGRLVSNPALGLPPLPPSALASPGLTLQLCAACGAQPVSN